MKLLRHIVLFAYHDSVAEGDKVEVARRFGELPGKIDLIDQFEWGRNNSPEGLDHGYQHGFMVTFRSEAARDAYLPHPAHQEFVAFLKPFVKEALVFDYWT